MTSIVQSEVVEQIEEVLVLEADEVESTKALGQCSSGDGHN